MIVFRADANAEIGTGHVMRCLSLADAVAAQGQVCHFVLAQDDFAALVRQRGFPCTVLHTDYTDMVGELPALECLAQKLMPSHIIADSYFVTSPYLLSLGKLAKLAYIDDMAAFAYPVDLLINYNIYADAEIYRALYQKEGCPLPAMLLGTSYAPLRTMFQNLPGHPQPNRIKRVLVSTGGADPLHIAARMVYYLLQNFACRRGREYHFVLGAANPDAGEIKKMAMQESWLKVHQNVQDMASLMCACDAAISASGSTLYELCACGLPTVTYALADNQLPAARTFAEMGLMLSAGDYREQKHFFAGLFTLLNELDNNVEQRGVMAEKMQAQIDGRGAERLLQRLYTVSSGPKARTVFIDKPPLI